MPKAVQREASSWTLSTVLLNQMRALRSATDVPSSRVLEAGARVEVAKRIALLTDEQRAAFVAAGGVLPT